MLRYFFLFLFIVSSLTTHIVYAQKVELYSANLFPAEPYGGTEELKRLVKQCMVYPAWAIENEIEGEVFIDFKIDAEGQILESKISGTDHESLRNEAFRIFKRIHWIKDEGRSGKVGGYDKIKIEFNLKKYQKLVKNRGYTELPLAVDSVSDDMKVYTINQVEDQPQISNAKNVNAFVAKHFKYPSIAIQRGISGRVIVDFVIEPYGLVSNIQIIESLPGGCDEEAKRLVKMMEWTPALLENKAVRCLYRYELNFVNPGGVIR